MIMSTVSRALGERRTLIEKSSMVLPLGPPMEGLTPPSSSAMRPRSCATCRSCSSSCSRCCSTFSWAIRYEHTPVNAQRHGDAGCHARSSSGRNGTDRPRRCPGSECPWAGVQLLLLSVGDTLLVCHGRSKCGVAVNESATQTRPI